MNLLQAMMSIQYDAQRGIWAQKIGGDFKPESPARFGQMRFENGGLLDGMVYFSDGETVTDLITDELVSITDPTGVDYQEAAQFVLEWLDAYHKEIDGWDQ